MTEKQQRFIEFIVQFRKDNGYSPSVREIAKGLGLSSPSTVQSMLDKLTTMGVLSRSSGVARSATISEAVAEMIPQSEMGIPIIGHIQAGTPVMAEENIEGYIPVQEFLNASSGGFFLVVDGLSMKDKGIHPGDYVFIKPEKTIANGQMGAFRLNGEVTLKTFRKTDDGIFLMPANEDFKPIPVLETDEFEVIGRYIMLLRLTERGYGFGPV